MQYLIGLLGILVSGIVYLFIKKGSAEALLNNTETKGKVLDLERERAKLGAAAEFEQLRRELEAKNAEERKNNPIDPKDFN